MNENNDNVGDGWENCHVVIRCLWDDQETSGNLGFVVTFFHRIPITPRSKIDWL